MYIDYFQLKHEPFSIAPDPRYLFMSERHREALAHLLYGVGGGGGFVLLTGEVGAGKTTVCRCFIEQLPPNCRLAYVFNPRVTVPELLHSLCEEFGIPRPASEAGGVKSYVDALNAWLLAGHAEGRNSVLVIDEAQNLSAEVLEQLRLLTNLETSERKLLQIILIGQPELRTMLARPDMDQLAQRVIARYHLGPLSVAETAQYVAHRLAVAGALAVQPIPARLAPLIHRLSGGVPRRINLLCDRALLGAYAEGRAGVTAGVLRKAGAEVFGDRARIMPRRAVLASGAVVLGLAAGAFAMVRYDGVDQGARGVPRIASAGAGGQAVSGGAGGAASVPGGAASAVSAPAALAGGAVRGALQSGASKAEGVQLAEQVQPSALQTVLFADEASALQALAGRWNEAADAAQACAGAPRRDLHCHRSRAGLFELRLLDRPAVIPLRAGAVNGYALMQALDDTSVTLVRDGRRLRVPVTQLVQWFDGSFATYWRMPARFRPQLADGDQGPEVAWLRAGLGWAASPDAGAGASPQVDAAFKKRLAEWQAAQQLKPDGMVGPKTYMKMNQASQVPEPRLLDGGSAPVLAAGGRAGATGPASPPR